MDLTPFRNCLAHKRSIYISNESKPYMPCCWFTPGVEATSYKDYQQKLGEIDIATGCKHCIEQESAGATWSHRHLFKDEKELVIGVCFDNICNIKCVTCSPYHSSQHISEWEKLGKLAKQNKDKKYFVKLMEQGPDKLALVEDTILNTEFDKIRLEIFGGEPLINPVVLKFINWLVEKDYAKITKLVITTNGTTSLKVVEQALEHFKQVTIQFSVDGLDDIFEVLRFGAKFNTMKENVDYFRSLVSTHRNYEYGFNYTLSWLNAINFKDFYLWLIGNYADVNSLHLTKLYGPKHYAVELLPSQIRQQLALDNVPVPNQQFERLLNLYNESMALSAQDDNDPIVYSRNKTSLDAGRKELAELAVYRDCDITCVQPILDIIDRSYIDYPAKWPKGHVIKTYCKEFDQWAHIADGERGHTDELVKKESWECGWRPPLLEKGFCVGIFCKDSDEWGKYADGQGGFYEELRLIDSPYCELKNDNINNK